MGWDGMGHAGPRSGTVGGRRDEMKDSPSLPRSGRRPSSVTDCLLENASCLQRSRDVRDPTSHGTERTDGESRAGAGSLNPLRGRVGGFASLIPALWLFCRACQEWYDKYLSTHIGRRAAGVLTSTLPDCHSAPYLPCESLY